MKTNELIGSALDWAVLEAAGAYSEYVSWRKQVGDQVLPKMEWFLRLGGRPSIEWAQGGPIIEREGIGIRVHCTHNNVITSWAAEKDWPMNVTAGSCGPTPLIAAMRCFVASKLGDEIEIP